MELSASTLNSQQIELDFGTNSGDDDVVIVFNTNGIFTAPTGAPVLGQPLAGGTVIFIGTASPVTHSGLTPGTTRFYKVFSYTGSNYSLGLTANATPEVTPASNLSAICAGSTQIDLNWIKNIYDHDVMVAAHSTYMSGNPVNGTNYNVGSSIPSGGTVIYKGSAGAFNHDDLDPWSQYYYKAWSVDIYNYYSTGEIANAITDADTITALPHLQDFGAAWSHNPAAPNLWKVVDVGGTGLLTWKRENGFYYVGPAAAEGGGSMDDYLISPPIRP